MKNSNPKNNTLRRTRGKSNFQLTQMPSKSYKGQGITTFKLPGSPVLLTTTVTTGLLTTSQACDVGQIIGFSTRFGNTFDEARVIKISYQVRCIGANPGVARLFFDEKSSAAPTLNDAKERVGWQISCSNAARQPPVMVYTPHDLADLPFTAIGSTNTVVYFKVYSDNSTFGSSTVATPYLLLEPTYTVQFRGLKSA